MNDLPLGLLWTRHDGEWDGIGWFAMGWDGMEWNGKMYGMDVGRRVGDGELSTNLLGGGGGQ